MLLHAAERFKGGCLPGSVTRGPVACQCLLQAVQGVRVAPQGRVTAAQYVQDVTHAVWIIGLGESAMGLQQVIDGLLGAVKLKERRSQVSQGNAFAEAIAHLAVQVQSQTQQLDCLLSPPQLLVGAREVVRGLCFSSSVPDLATDRLRLFQVTDAVAVPDKPERLAEVVQQP